ncbi:MAG: DUF1722 domain-containing protein [Pseudomonadota bacterium]|nr:MAG: DUF1722 domain-containing protein [Pseudomonadota bacterium]
MTNPKTTGNSIRVGISSCLLGAKVRYDGNHKLDSFIADTLGRHFEFVPVCPELAIGMGVPRAPIRLVGQAASPRAVGVMDPDMDVTDKLHRYGRRMAHELSDISGYIFKSKSPSCGMERVKVFPARGGPGIKNGRGVYAAALMAAQPLLPTEEEGRLGDPTLRENFIESVFAYRRWQELTARGVTASRLVEFHARHKLVLMAHDAIRLRWLGRIIAQTDRARARETGKRYIEEFMSVLRRPPTRARHSNVLMHLLGYLKRDLDHADKRELLTLIDRYRRGHLPRAVPLAILAHHFRRHPHPYVAGQYYLEPAPEELMLRCGV